MRVDAEAPTIRLADYRPPAFLADTVELTFGLDPAATRVRARVAFRRNPARAGEGRSTSASTGATSSSSPPPSTARRCPQNALALDDEGLTVAAGHVPDAFTWEAEIEIDPEANTALEGLYMSRGMFCTQCEAEGFRKITFWPDRPDVLASFSVRIEGERAGPALQRQPRGLRRPAAPSGTTPSPSPPTSSRWSRASSTRSRTASPPAPAARCCCRSGSPRRRGPLRLRHGRAEAGDGLGRGGLRPRVRPRPVHDRGGATTSTSGRWRTRG